MAITTLADVNAALNGRKESDVALTDEYWKVANRYRFEQLKKKYLPERSAFEVATPLDFEFEGVEEFLKANPLIRRLGETPEHPILPAPEHPIVLPPSVIDLPEFPTNPIVLPEPTPIRDYSVEDFFKSL